MALVIYVAVTIPLDISFGMPLPAQTLNYLDWAIDCVFLADMCINFRTAFWDGQGHLVRQAVAVVVVMGRPLQSRGRCEPAQSRLGYLVSWLAGPCRPTVGGGQHRGQGPGDKAWGQGSGIRGKPRPFWPQLSSMHSACSISAGTWPSMAGWPPSLRCKSPPALPVTTLSTRQLPWPCPCPPLPMPTFPFPCPPVTPPVAGPGQPPHCRELPALLVPYRPSSHHSLGPAGHGLRAG